MEIHFPMFWELHGFLAASSEKFQKHLTLKCLCFLIFFPYYGNSLFPYFGSCMDFCFTQNIWEPLECFFSHTFPELSESTFPTFWELYRFMLHPKILKKPINLKCLCFPILFPNYGNPLFPCFGNCMGFCFIPKFHLAALLRRADYMWECNILGESHLAVNKLGARSCVNSQQRKYFF